MRRWKRKILLFMAVSIAAASLPAMEAGAAKQVLALSSAKELAIQHSTDYRQLKSEISLAQIQYTEAVKSAALQKKDKLSFRWSPLLNFKFPEQPDLIEASEWQYKPMQAQNKLIILRHELEMLRYSVEEEIGNLYVDAYVLQETVDFTQERLDNLEDTLKRNQWKVYTGEALSSDIEKMEAELEKLTGEQADYLRRFESLKEKISDRIGTDITVGWKFIEPFQNVTLKRSSLKEFQDYTLNRDHAFYEKKLSTALALHNLELNEDLIAKKYGRYMYLIDPYLAQIKEGKSFDAEAFENSYDLFLQEIDKKWQGNFSILFIKIPKEWIKGELDGVRYMEDEPYTLFTLAMEYDKLRIEEENAEKELKEVVAGQFEALITAGNSWKSMAETIRRQEEEVEENLLLNREGKVTWEELRNLQQAYEQSQLDLIVTYGEYTKLLNSFDRLTCGGVRQFIEYGSLPLNAAYGGDSFLTAEEKGSLWYSMESRVEDYMFVLRISVPEELRQEITHYELWVDKTQIGERTKADQALSHLTLALEDTKKVTIRFYKGNTFVDECEIDPMASKGELTIQGSYHRAAKENKTKLGTFSIQKNPVTQLMVFSITGVESKEIAAYNLTDKTGAKLYQTNPIPIGRELPYLALAAKDIGELKVEFYDKDGQKIYTGRLDAVTMTILAED